MSRGLERTITPAQGVALYVGAVVGTGVLILPGTAASLAGPASVVAWALVSLLGIPLALTFAALPGRYPDAGGVATFAGRAFGSGWGSVGSVAVLLLWAVFGWEAIAQLSAEFQNPAHDVPRSTLLSFGIIALLYIGVATAVIGTATYGSAAVDRVAVATCSRTLLGRAWVPWPRLRRW